MWIFLGLLRRIRESDYFRLRAECAITDAGAVRKFLEQARQLEH